MILRKLKDKLHGKSLGGGKGKHSFFQRMDNPHIHQHILAERPLSVMIRMNTVFSLLFNTTIIESRVKERGGVVEL